MVLEAQEDPTKTLGYVNDADPSATRGDARPPNGPAALLLGFRGRRLKRSRGLNHRCLLPDEPVKCWTVDTLGL